MGTVPDPLRSTKLSLVTASEESPKHQYRQASVESNSHGYPFTSKDQPSGECLFEVSCGREDDVPKSEWHCGYDTKHPSMYSSRSFSTSKECSLAASEPVDYAKQECSSGSRAEVQVPSEDHALVDSAIKMPVTQEANKKTQHNSDGQSYNVIDRGATPTEGDCSVMESNTKDCSILPSLPTHFDIQKAAPAGNENVGEIADSEKSQEMVPSDDLEPVSDLSLKAPDCFKSQLESTKHADFCLRTGTEMAPRCNLGGTPEPSCSYETTAKVVSDLSKFKDTGTMTQVQPESRPAAAEAISRIQQDAGVQAVASMESKSAATSPSIFAAFLRENMPSKAKQDQDELHIIYTGATGQEQSERVDNFAALVQTPPSLGIMHKVHVQTPATKDRLLGAPTAKLQEEFADKHDPTCSELLDKPEGPCPIVPDNSPEPLVKRIEVQITNMAKNHSDIPQQVSDSSLLQETRPVYQIIVSSSNQSAVPQYPADLDTELPPCFSIPKVNNKHQHSEPSALQEHHPPLEQAKAVAITDGTYQETQLQIKTVSETESGLPSFPVDVKSKKEDKFVLPRPEEQKMNNTEVTAGSQTMSVPAAVESRQDTFPGDTKAETLDNQNQLSESGRNVASAVGTQNDRTQKGQVLDVPAAPASSRPLPSLGEKKKEPKAVPAEAKLHLKQSKRVRDVVWDEQGMTWEVYGASLDPESLGIAIQNHLQRQIREHEKLIKAQSNQARKSISSDTSSNRKLKGRHHNVFHSMLQNFRRPNCCIRPAASSVLD